MRFSLKSNCIAHQKTKHGRCLKPIEVDITQDNSNNAFYNELINNDKKKNSTTTKDHKMVFFFYKIKQLIRMFLKIYNFLSVFYRHLTFNYFFILIIIIIIIVIVIINNYFCNLFYSY